MNNVETIDDYIQPYVDYLGDPSIGGKRPVETEADLIAACAKPGSLEIRQMAQVIRPGSAEWHDTHCLVCSTDSDKVEYYNKVVQGNRSLDMHLHGVEWDPTITF